MLARILILLVTVYCTPAWAAVEVLRGGEQTITVGTPSADMVFRFVDESGTTLLNNAAVSFSATDANGQVLNNALSVNNAITDIAGIAATRFNASDSVGQFTITAQLTNNPDLSVSTTLTITPSAGLNVVNGTAQSIDIGVPSAAIEFNLFDASLNPISGVSVIFALFDATGDAVSNGLLIPDGITDAEGLVVTRTNPLTSTGVYTITARLLNDASVSASTILGVTTGDASVLTVSAGNNQSIPAGRDSDAVQFRLSDGFDNAVANRAVNFMLVTPSGENTSSGLSPASAVTDLNGRVNTRLSATQIQGDYRIVASLAEDNSITATANLTITPPLTALPSLGFGGAISNTGAVIPTTATFNGGVALNDGAFFQEVIYRAEDNLNIKGVINVDPAHVGQVADILLVAAFTSAAGTPEFIMLNTENALLPWDGSVSSLTAFRSGILLERVEELEFFTGRLSEPGLWQVFFGYRLGNGTVVYNIEHVIGLYLD